MVYYVLSIIAALLSVALIIIVCVALNGDEQELTDRYWHEDENSVEAPDNTKFYAFVSKLITVFAMIYYSIN